MGQPIRVENVGSLLRPPELLATRERHAAGTFSDAELKRAEDTAVDAAVALQEQVGLDVLTDGEFRRRGWLTHFFESVDGFQMGAGPALPWRDDTDGPLPDELRTPLRPVVTDTLRWRHSAGAEEWVYLRGATQRPKKATLISAEMAAAMYEPERSGAAYPTREAYFADVVALLRDEVAELVRLGCEYIQLDAPQYPAVRAGGVRSLPP